MRGCLIVVSIIALVVLAPTLVIPFLHLFTIPMFAVTAVVLLVALNRK